MDYFTQLGDPQNKSASNADFHLTNLLADHPNMKVRLFNLLIPSFGSVVTVLLFGLNVYLFVQAVVIDEVDCFLFRPHLGLRAKYHAVCPFINCSYFQKILVSIGLLLLDTNFSLFYCSSLFTD